MPVAGGLERARDDFLGRLVPAQRVDCDASQFPRGPVCGAARSRDPRTSCSSGTSGAAASAVRTAGTCSRAAPRSCASRGACRGGTSTFSSWGRPSGGEYSHSLLPRLNRSLPRSSPGVARREPARGKPVDSDNERRRNGMYKIAAIIGGVLLMAGVALAGTVSSLGAANSPTIGQTIPTASVTVRQEDRAAERRGREAEARGRANEPGEDVRHGAPRRGGRARRRPRRATAAQRRPRRRVRPRRPRRRRLIPPGRRGGPRPLSRAASSSSQFGPMSRPKRTILLVEDETSIREPLAEVLRSEGFETLVAGHGRRGARAGAARPRPRPARRDAPRRLRLRRLPRAAARLAGADHHAHRPRRGGRPRDRARARRRRLRGQAVQRPRGGRADPRRPAAHRRARAATTAGRSRWPTCGSTRPSAR